ncbi:HET-domain-containing protein [Colletotrichum zoysiae]|uniref:HET-domain-containing protein n=1 Tax=Colletotrichum zoysiae TaxID=1216348 RepID=A0AAD9HVV2_9PEZI|nr:HET-domain-containing protein [Colletotrichum zoysiae]
MEETIPSITPQPYQYTPLRNDVFEIRLLHILPATSTDCQLKCRLETSDILSVVHGILKYEALSYTWGTEAPTEKLTIDETRYLNITSSLASFLRQRRDLSKAVVIWVDAVCINQEDIVERNSQVSMMDGIYLACTTMSIWLGREGEHSDLGMMELTNLAKSPTYTSVPLLSKEVCNAIEKLLSRPWWTRVWIVQEICRGGAGSEIWPDLDALVVRCGGSSICWNYLVLACARIKVDESSLLQTIAGVEKVLHLDYIRWSGKRLVKKGLDAGFDENDFLRLVRNYRHFDATDPRDKIYGLLGMLRNLDTTPHVFGIKYADTTEEVYARFATKMVQASLGMELLRDCGGAQMPEESPKLPSWIPDWSRKRCDAPLPSYLTGKVERDVPWWAVPRLTYKGNGVRQASFPMTYEKAREEMERVLKGGEVGFEPQEFAKYCPPDFVKTLQEMVDSKKLVFGGLHDEHYVDPRENLGFGAAQAKFINANEIIKQRQFVRGWVDENKAKQPEFSAGLGADSQFVVDHSGKMAEVDGIIWDEIETAQAPFPEELHSNWESSTHFMVAVGQCKRLAMNAQHTTPYTSREAKHTAFWDTLVAGQTVYMEHNFEDCLPAIPETWLRTDAPLTHRNPRQAERAELQVLLASRKKDIGDIIEANPKTIPAFYDLPPVASSSDQVRELTARFQDLGNLWSSQPYDLYHRPFVLPSVVPDPYWESRRRFDKKALDGSSRSRRERWVPSLLGPNQHARERLQKLASEACGKEPSIVPQHPDAENSFQLEKYSLGRRFFITRRGYMGIGPAGTKAGDSVVVLLGAQVPFVLRSRGLNKYEVVGETYVSGIMKGEVLTNLAESKREVQRLTLV